MIIPVSKGGLALVLLLVLPLFGCLFVYMGMKRIFGNSNQGKSFDSLLSGGMGILIGLGFFTALALLLYPRAAPAADPDADGIPLPAFVKPTTMISPSTQP